MHEGRQVAAETFQSGGRQQYSSAQKGIMAQNLLGCAATCLPTTATRPRGTSTVSSRSPTDLKPRSLIAEMHDGILCAGGRVSCSGRCPVGFYCSPSIADPPLR